LPNHQKSNAQTRLVFISAQIARHVLYLDLYVMLGFDGTKLGLLNKSTFENMSAEFKADLTRVRNKFAELQTCSHCGKLFTLESSLGLRLCTNGNDHIDYCKDTTDQCRHYAIPLTLLAFFKIHRALFTSRVDEAIFDVENRDKYALFNRFNGAIDVVEETT